MNLSKIKNDLQQVLQLVEDWHEKGVDAIERDLVLGMLRELYSQVRFGATPEPESIAPEAEGIPVGQGESVATDLAHPEVEELPIGIAISLDDVFEEFMPEGLMPESVAMPLEQEREEEPATEPTEVSEEPVTKEPTPEIVKDEVAEVVEEPVTEEPASKIVEDKADEVVEELATEEPVQPTEPMVEKHPAQEEIEEESMAEMPTAEATEEIPEPSATEPAVGQPSLFGDDEFFVPRPSRRTRMMSLYDDEQRNEVVISKPISEPKSVEVAPTPKQTPAPQPTAQSAEPTKLSVEVLEEEDEFTEVDVETMPIENGEVADSTETQVESAAERDVEMLPSEPYIEPQIEMTVATPAASAVPESEQVLGEVIKSDVQTFGDTIKPKDTAAEQIVKGSVVDITKAVGINDRFLLIRDLFGGSSEEYDRVMATLNSFDNLEDCMIHIVENYDWNPNSDGAKLIMELLERKYS